MANSANTFAGASGHGTSPLTRFDPQPHTDGLQYPVETPTPTAVYEDGAPFVLLRFNAPHPVQLARIYSQLGLTSAKTANVTVSLPTNVERTSWADYNGQAVRPRVNPWEILRYGWVEILVRKLEAV